MAEPKFEKDLEKLEEIVEALEAGGLSLDESLKQFEEGIKLTSRCEKALKQAEKRIEILMKNAEGELEAQPFGDEEEPEPEPSRRKKHSADPDPDEGEAEDEDEGLLF